MRRLSFAILFIFSLVISLGSDHPTAIAGPHPKVSDQATAIVLALAPPTASVQVGENFTLDIRVDSGAQEVTGVAAFVNFDPNKLQVQDADGNPGNGVQIQGGAVFDVELLNTANNSLGQIDFNAGTFSMPFPSGTFIVATITFKAIAVSPVGGTNVTFSTVGIRETDTDFSGISVLDSTQGATVSVSLPPPPVPGVSAPGLGLMAALLTVAFLWTLRRPTRQPSGIKESRR